MSTTNTTTLNRRAIALLVVTGILLSGCQPKNGDPGPQGATGAVGAQGSKGDTGAQGSKGDTGAQGSKGDTGSQGSKGDTGSQGPKGDTGSANVIYSPWTSVSFTGSGSSYIGNLTATPITQEVLDKADIRVYWNESGRVLSLPYAEVAGSTTYTVHQRFYVGRIELKASYALNPQQMRYVIIPGSVAAGRRGAVDFNDYQAVRQVFNIPD